MQAITEARGVPAVADVLRGVTDPGQLADMSGYSPDLSFEQKVEVLETLDVEARLEKVLRWAKDTLAEVQVRERIRDEVAGSLEERQREMLLREQMAAIRKELGEDGTEDVLEEYRTKIADAGMPEDVRSQADRELGRLERTSEQSPEYGWIRTYLDWLLDVPWSSKTEDNLDIGSAREVLDADHEGLRDVKDRILEYLAVRKLRSERGSPRPVVVAPVRSSRWSALRASARRRSGSRSHAPSGATSSGSRSAASTTSPRSVATVGPTWGRCRDGSCVR